MMMMNYHINSSKNVVKFGRFRWFGQLECNNADDLVSTCRNMEAVGV